MSISRPPVDSKVEVLVVGAGAIGLSIAWELSRRGVAACVLERDVPGRQASWAAAGMLPVGPAPSHWGDATPLEQLTGLSQRLHRQWHEELLELTGIDNELSLTGALHLADSPALAEDLVAALTRAERLDIRVERLTEQDVRRLEPQVAVTAPLVFPAAYYPDEGRVRSPRHLKALEQACLQAGVRVVCQASVQGWMRDGDRLIGVETSQGRFWADRFCVTTGCWTGELLRGLGLRLSTSPVRGQIALFDGPTGLLARHLCVGSRYLVPRSDGLLLVGSTEENVGFDPTTTPDAIDALRRFALVWAPALERAKIVHAWAGLRPSAPDGLPTLGRCAALENLWVAVGHYRGGIQLAPATAVLLADLMTGHEPPLDPSPFGWRDAPCGTVG